jgi:hypothetical protein
LTTLTVLGISRIQYPQKKIPEAKPMNSVVNPSPPFSGGSPMPSAAAEMFTRSRYARMYKKNSHGISRRLIRRRARSGRPGSLASCVASKGLDLTRGGRGGSRENGGGPAK